MQVCRSQGDCRGVLDSDMELWRRRKDAVERWCVSEGVSVSIEYPSDMRSGKYTEQPRRSSHYRPGGRGAFLVHGVALEQRLASLHLDDIDDRQHVEHLVRLAEAGCRYEEL